MGNLRDKYTDQEWVAINSRLEKERQQGKPTELLLPLSIWNKELVELEELRTDLSKYYSKSELSLLIAWIEWKRKTLV